jgi:uncharacterized Zn finger protein
MMLQQSVKHIDLNGLAIPSNIAYGTAIYERGAVEVISQSDKQIEAWAGGLDGSVKAGGGSRRRVQLMTAGTELHWHCTGNPKDHDIFCKHCVAVALFLRNR